MLVTNALELALLAPEAPREPAADGLFQPDEVLMLRMASSIDPSKYAARPDGQVYLIEGKAPLKLTDDEKRQLLIRASGAGGRQRRLAVLLSAMQLLSQRLKLDTEQYRQALRAWPDDLRKMAQTGIFAGLTGRDIPPLFSPEFRQMAAGSSRAIDGMRAARASEAETLLLVSLTNKRITKVVEDDYAPSLGSEELAPADFSIRRLPFGQELKIQYNGKRPLTNVIMIGTVRQTNRIGPRFEIPLGAIDSFNRSFGSTEKQADDAQRLLRAADARSRMPKEASGYKATIEPGQTLAFVLGEMERGVEDNNPVTLAIFADQGRITARDIGQFPTLAAPARPASKPAVPKKGTRTPPKKPRRR